MEQTHAHDHKHRGVLHRFSFLKIKKARAERAAGRSRFSIYFTWLQAAANHHDDFGHDKATGCRRQERCRQPARSSLVLEAGG
jgi:hypothetical protein